MQKNLQTNNKNVQWATKNVQKSITRFKKIYVVHVRCPSHVKDVFISGKDWNLECKPGIKQCVTCASIGEHGVFLYFSFMSKYIVDCLYHFDPSSSFASGTTNTGCSFTFLYVTKTSTASLPCLFTISKP